MGLPSTYRPTAMGQATSAVILGAEPVILPAPRRSRRASAPDTAGITAAVTAAIKGGGQVIDVQRAVVVAIGVRLMLSRGGVQGQGGLRLPPVRPCSAPAGTW